MYSGDEGGILLSLSSVGSKEEPGYMVSLTHVNFDPDHELAEAVTAYQKRRIHRLMLQDRKGFAALQASSKRKKRKPSKGFGRP
ncbi:MAG: hypothetical protein AAGG02_19565 [Cyanobacteria bacterium P01_H01_bin.15]